MLGLGFRVLFWFWVLGIWGFSLLPSFFDNMTPNDDLLDGAINTSINIKRNVQFSSPFSEVEYYSESSHHHHRPTKRTQPKDTPVPFFLHVPQWFSVSTAVLAHLWAVGSSLEATYIAVASCLFHLHYELRQTHRPLVCARVHSSPSTSEFSCLQFLSVNRNLVQPNISIRTLNMGIK